MRINNHSAVIRQARFAVTLCRICITLPAVLWCKLSRLTVAADSSGFFNGRRLNLCCDGYEGWWQVRVCLRASQISPWCVVKSMACYIPLESYWTYLEFGVRLMAVRVKSTEWREFKSQVDDFFGIFWTYFLEHSSNVVCRWLIDLSKSCTWYICIVSKFYGNRTNKTDNTRDPI